MSCLCKVSRILWQARSLDGGSKVYEGLGKPARRPRVVNCNWDCSRTVCEHRDRPPDCLLVETGFKAPCRERASMEEKIGVLLA